MKNIEVTAKEITYLLISLRKYEESLLNSDTEEMEDATTDLLFIQSLITKLKAVKETK
jgi:hypothetical protein